ncbi:hypothetical protein RHGRI_030172 [Rhododendron griersonianum]|uniref:Uncharacterized protein n=1 Tax=Rhododendron griersonianum TaxID=479676 RepID=A0AAV6IQJ4_9ERIC|nr:hypothetical protein RHGRI_030172 [Rhododendron griersonianum]
MFTDELAVTRAAAWAWYQRGSGSEPKPVSEFGLTRTHHRVPNPTRYKLEAERSRSSTSDHGSHLLDSYEIDSISRHLERYIERVNNGDLVDLGTTDLVGKTQLANDLSTRIVPLSSRSKLTGKVELMLIFKKKKAVDMNCTMKLNTATQSL